MAQAWINDMFQKHLGRAASTEEINSIKKYMADGYITAMDAEGLISGSPEAQQRRFETQAPQYEGMLRANDQYALGAAQDSLTRRFLQQGRGTTGSAYLAAFSNAAAELARSRSDQMAQFYGQGFGESRQAYGTAAQRAYGTYQGRAQEARERQYATEDYNTMKNDYQNYLENAKNLAKRKSTGSQIGRGVGMTLGAGMAALSGPGMAFAPGFIQGGGQFGERIGGMA